MSRVVTPCVMRANRTIHVIMQLSYSNGQLQLYIKGFYFSVLLNVNCNIKTDYNDSHKIVIKYAYEYVSLSNAFKNIKLMKPRNKIH